MYKNSSTTSRIRGTSIDAFTRRTRGFGQAFASPSIGALATTAFISYGFFWLSLVALIGLPKLGFVATDDVAMGAYLAMWGLFTAVMFIGTFRLNRALQVVFGTLTVLFALLACEHFNSANVSTGFKHFTGFEGLLCGFAAIYTGLAQVLNELFGKIVLPLGMVKK